MATNMPTGAKAIGAASFAVVGWLTANAYVPNLPEATPGGPVYQLMTAMGAVVGWKIMGNAVGKGYWGAIGSGWKTVVVLVFFAMLLFGIYEMLQQSVKMRYDGPFEAVVDVFNRMMERSIPLLTVGVMSVMIVGGALAGVLTENANRRWR
jgi:hypothetical protein